jgi:hypothetical protein
VATWILPDRNVEAPRVKDFRLGPHSG